MVRLASRRGIVAPPQRLTVDLSVVSSARAPITNAPARTNIAASVEPVASMIEPIMYGLTKPARFPTELITAMPAAAAVPPRNDVGSDENNGAQVMTPAAAIDSEISHS